MPKPVAFKIVLPDIYNIPILFVADLIALHEVLGDIIRKYQLADERMLKEAAWEAKMAGIKPLCECEESLTD